MDPGTAVPPMEMSKSSSVQLDLAAVSSQKSIIRFAAKGEWSAECAGLMASIISIDRFSVRLCVWIDGSAPISPRFLLRRHARTATSVLSQLQSFTTPPQRKRQTQTSAPTRSRTLQSARRRYSPPDAATAPSRRRPKSPEAQFPIFRIWRQTSTKYPNEDAISALNVTRLSITDTCAADERTI